MMELPEDVQHTINLIRERISMLDVERAILINRIAKLEMRYGAPQDLVIDATTGLPVTGQALSFHKLEKLEEERP